MNYQNSTASGRVRRSIVLRLPSATDRCRACVPAVLAGIAVAASTADCGPVLFADVDARVIGAAHAGWRRDTADGTHIIEGQEGRARHGRRCAGAREGTAAQGVGMIDHGHACCFRGTGRGASRSGSGGWRR